MNLARWVASGVAVVCIGGGARAQGDARTERSEKLLRAMESARKRFDRIPVRHERLLSSGARNLAHLAQSVVSLSSSPRRGAPLPVGGVSAPGAPMRRAPASEQDPAVGRGPAPPRAAALASVLTGGKVSDPVADSLNGLLGFTQSQTHTAWCGSNVVVGFNDSGSLIESSFDVGGLSMNGVSRSTNKGVSFTDLGYLPSSNPDHLLEGNPVLGCTDANTFYYATLLTNLDTGASEIGISKSTNGGATWADPVPAASKPLGDPGHFLDKPWMVVVPDPASPTDRSKDVLYVSYTDFDSTGSLCGTSEGSPISRTGIELTRSVDGGSTWSTPVSLFDGCDPDGASGVQLAVGPAGEVYAAWEYLPAASPTTEIAVRKSTDIGVTWGRVITATPVAPAGGLQTSPFSGEERQWLQGHTRSNDFPTLAVDRSGGVRNGWVYLAWNDGRSLTVPDPSADSGTYGFSDILLVRSTDGGASWTRIPVRVNNSVEPLTAFGPGSDQYQPAMAVDKAGAIGICFYDRRRDPGNFLVDRQCAKSVDGGVKWTTKKISAFQFLATPNQDQLLGDGVFGDYDSLTSDASNVNVGLLGAYSETGLGTPDVKVNRP